MYNAKLTAEYPHLTPVSDKNDSLVAAAKNIRVELARAFPGVKFSVKSRRFSMGDAIDVKWIDGPTTEQVDAIIGAYSGGTFDGMTDSYEYTRSDWTDTFGEGKYVHSSREYSDKVVANVIGRVCRRLGGLDRFPTVEDYRRGRIWNVHTSGGCDVGRELSVALSRHTLAVTR
jgi:hypothetical protein